MAPTAARSATYRAPRFRAGAGESLALATTTVLGVALVWAITQFDGFEAEPESAGLLVVGAIACLAIIMAGPIPCLAMIGGLTAAGYVPSLANIGFGADLTLADVFLVGLAGWWLWAAIGRSQGVRPARLRVAFGQIPAFCFLAYVGLTLVHVADSNPDALDTSLVSWLSLVQTGLLAVLAASVIETKRDVWVLLGAVTTGAVIAVLGTVLEGVSLTERSGGTLGPNSLGLVSGVLLLISAFAVPRRFVLPRVLLVAIALLGLLLAKSAAAFIAVGLAVAVGAAFVSPGGVAQRVGRRAVAVALVCFLAFGVVKLVRPEVIPGSEGFRGGSAAHRIVVGAAGLEIFERNPVIGVGWRGSDSPQVIGDREVVAEVHKRFPDARPVFFPDVTPTSVHNTYVQILADLGAVGFALFAALIGVIAFRSVALLRRLGRDDDLWGPAFAISLSLLLILVWYNDNPLYGGQPETVLPALFVGALAAVAGFSSRFMPPVRAVYIAPARRATPLPSGARVATRPAPAFAAATLGTEAAPALPPPPIVLPGTGRRITVTAGIVLVAAVIGLLGGWWADDRGGPSSVAPTGADRALIDYQATVAREIEQLEVTRTRAFGRLNEARTPRDQAAAISELARGHAAMAQSLTASPNPSTTQQERGALIAALTQVAEAYRQLGAAATGENARAYEDATQRVGAAETRLRTELATATKALTANPE